ncbi:MAG: BrnT family toxin, partial [Spirochaetaceae bacterium]|nr:BrnT family toxin [Spirochaetaceae bacterium]
MYGELAFTWHQRKNAENLRKHGIDFEKALFVFKDPNLVKFRDEKHSANEDRWNVLGLVGTAVLFVV